MKTPYIILATAAAAAILAACNEVKEGDRYIDMPAIEVKRSVLIEDFTGQNCPNCPTAHLYIEELEQQYGDAVIPVSIHAGGLSYPITNKRRNGLATETGNIYDGALPTHNYPAIVVDGHSSTVYNGVDNEWVNAVRNALQTDVAVELECRATHHTDADGVKRLSISTEIKPYADYSGKLQLWIIENDIVAYQSTLTGAITDYVHQNVFRAAANGTWGQPLSLAANVYSTVDNTYTISGEWEETWDLDHLAIVAFIYNDSGVAQATRAKVVPAADDPDTDDPDAE